MRTTKRGKGTKLMALTDASGLPLAVHATSASPHEVTLVEATLAANRAREEPERLQRSAEILNPRWIKVSGSKHQA